MNDVKSDAFKRSAVAKGLEAGDAGAAQEVSVIKGGELQLVSEVRQRTGDYMKVIDTSGNLLQLHRDTSVEKTTKNPCVLLKQPNGDKSLQRLENHEQATVVRNVFRELLLNFDYAVPPKDWSFVTRM